MKAKDLDRKFDDGEDMTPFVRPETLRRLNAEPHTVNVDFPDWMVQVLDREAKKLGVTREALIQTWIAEHIEKSAA